MNIFYFPSLCLDTFSVNLNSQNASFRRSMSLSYLKYYRDKNPSFYYCAKAVCCDCRILLIVFQKAAFQDANVCLFVFDCIYFNDVSLMDRCVCGRGEFWESPAMQTDQFSWAVTLGRSGQRGRDLAVPGSCGAPPALSTGISCIPAARFTSSKHTGNIGNSILSLPGGK